MRLKLFMAAGMLSVCLAASADTVTLVSGTITASVDGTTATTLTTNGSISYTGIVPISVSTTTVTSSASQIAFTFEQQFGLPDTSTAGTGEVDFTASGTIDYSITGLDATFGGAAGTTDIADTELYDQTTSTVVYDSYFDPTNLSGVLTSGDEYIFTSETELFADSDPTADYSPSISFTTATTPEPSSLLFLSTGLFAIAGAARRRLT